MRVRLFAEIEIKDEDLLTIARAMSVHGPDFPIVISEMEVAESIVRQVRKFLRDTPHVQEAECVFIPKLLQTVL